MRFLTLAALACLAAAGLIAIGEARGGAFASAQADTVFYVSPEGNDAWTGGLAAPSASRSDGPLRTVAGARDGIRRLKAKTGQPARAVTVLLRGGVYTLAEPLIFRPEDSGTPQARVTYAGYPGETAVLSGGRRITGWKRDSRDLRDRARPGIEREPDRG
jgi:hypothetical protein